MNERDIKIEECKNRLRGTTIKSVDHRARSMILMDNGRFYQLHFTYFPTTKPENIIIVPHINTCEAITLLPPPSKNIPDAMRNFTRLLDIQDPRELLR